MSRQTLEKAPVRRCACGGVIGHDGECARCKAARQVRSALASNGAPLDPATRAFFEPRLRADLSDVRVHRDGTAARSADAVGARAYTVGSDIVFGAGPSDRRLFAHELAHVLQQRGRPPTVQAASIEVGPADDPLERAAERVADGVMSDRDVSHELGHVATRRLLQRQLTPTCAGVAFDPASERCCDETILRGPAQSTPACTKPTTRDNEYDGCSVPDWLIEPARKDNPGGAYDTWFSDPAIHGTKPQSFVPRLPCDVHDKCYQTCGSDWEQCDNQLFIDARRVCETSRQRPGSEAYEQCIYAVDQAELLLPLGSRPSFDQRQLEYCACCEGMPGPALTRAGAIVKFRTGSSTPDKEALELIEKFVNDNAATLAQATSRLTLVGQASKLGSEENNLQLSADRVEVVRLLIDARIRNGFPGTVVRAPVGERIAGLEPSLGAADDSPDYRIVQVMLEGY